MTDTEPNTKRPRSGEAPFDFEEVFFSRTDERGVIQSGNKVFQRVTDHSWEKLLGASQNLTRHPDMPKGFFHLFRERLKNGRMASGYVKNLAADGLHYWVFALSSPLPSGGFISVQVKPTSYNFANVQAEYAIVRKREQEEDLSGEESGAIFVERLKELGFADFEHFMASSLAQELSARDEKLGRGRNLQGEQFSAISKAVRDAITHTNALCETFRAIEAVPHNMRILASRLEASGGPIAAISSNYGSMSREISDWVNHFVISDDSAFANLRRSVSRSRMLSAMVRLLEEARQQFENESDDPDNPINRHDEEALLKEVSRDYRDSADRYLGMVEKEAVVFGRAVGEMKRMIAGLSTTRMMCKIESARLPEKNESLMAIIGQLDKFQAELENRLEKIGEITATVLSASRGLGMGHAVKDRQIKYQTRKVA
ncbi:chemotaxis protein [Vannielia sp.]|uniref:chemotaxis protein n=1 Tax=Vannielia sp. TaxID=2813045 RepID=UPI00262D0FEF|nr:chemotaxis protein [Vannielia sp.]MDF1873834.1 chemotaxis protein [Vannielia sp.]